MPKQIHRYTRIVEGRIADPAIRARLIRYEQNDLAQRLTQQRVIEETRAHAPGFASSAVKLSGALNIQDGDELLLHASGTQGLDWDATESSRETSEITKAWLRQKALTIAGGTKEIQLNIIAKRVLGLPD